MCLVNVAILRGEKNMQEKNLQGFCFQSWKDINMRLEDIKTYCMNKWKAYEDYPFGDVPV